MTTPRPGAGKAGSPGRRLAALVLVLIAGLLALGLLPGCSLVEEDGATPDTRRAPDRVKRVLRSTVEVRAAIDPARTALGAGVAMGGGLIVTNDHVVAPDGEAATDITVIATGGKRAEAVLVLRVPDRDLAYLVADLPGLRPARFRDDLGALRRGTEAFAVGAPRHFKDYVVEGKIRRVLRNVRIQDRPGLNTLIQHSADLEQGFSGGPLADMQGRVVGINVATSVLGRGGEGYALSIPVALVLESAPRL